MREFILLMHNATTEATAEMWSAYFSLLHGSGVFEGGSAIGEGETFRRHLAPGHVSRHLVGYIRVQAESLMKAREFLKGNPVFECGGRWKSANCRVADRNEQTNWTIASGSCLLYRDRPHS